jgi:hypothetical protein
MTRQNNLYNQKRRVPMPDDQSDKILARVQLTPTQCNEVSGGQGDAYSLNPVISGKHTNIWSK